MKIRQYTLGLTLIYLLFSVLWIVSFNSKTILSSEIFVDTYWFLPIMGAVLGISCARIWGLNRDFIGLGLLSFSLFLLLQGLGQLGYSIEAHYRNTQLTFPSYIEILFVLALFSLLAGTCFFIMTFFVQIDQPDLRFRRRTLVIAVIFGSLLSTILLYYLYGYFLEVNSMLLIGGAYILAGFIITSIFLFMLPLSCAIHHAAFFRNLLFFLLAIICQTVADSFFIFEIAGSTWKLSALSDYFYLSSYFLFGLSIFYLGLKYYRDYNHKIIILFSYTSLLTAYIIVLNTILFS